MSCKCTKCKCGKQLTEPLVEQTEDQTKLRHFDLTTSDPLFNWHTNNEDSWIESLNENDWTFQFDNELPVSLEPGKIIQIPSGIIHRLIKGSSDLSISIKS